MKRPILVAALAVLLVATSCAGSGSDSKPAKKEAPERKGWSEGSLYGDVESIAITVYALTEKFGELVKDKIYEKEVYKFNPKGDVTEKACYNSDGLLSCKYLYKYDSQGNQVELAYYDYGCSLSCKYLNKYDSQGNQVEQAHYDSNGSLISKVIYKYDSQGNQIEWAGYSDGSLSWKNIGKYDSQGNMIEVAHYEDESMKPTRMQERTIVYRK